MMETVGTHQRNVALTSTDSSAATPAATATPEDGLSPKNKDLGVLSHQTSFTAATANPFGHNPARASASNASRSAPSARELSIGAEQPKGTVDSAKLHAILDADLAAIEAKPRRPRSKTIANKTDSAPRAPQTQAPKEPRPGVDEFKAAMDDPALLQQLVGRGTKETKTEFAHAILADPQLGPEKKLEVLRALIAPSRKRNDPNALTLDGVLADPPKSAKHGFNELLAGRDLALAKEVAAGTSPETLLMILSGVAHDPLFTPELRRAALGGLVIHVSKERLNYLMEQAVTTPERDSLSRAILGIPFEDRAGEDLTAENQQRLVDAVVTMQPPLDLAGPELAAMFTSMSVKNRNKLVDHLQEIGNLPAFLEAQKDRGYRLPELLPGLDPGNAAAFQRGFQRLADEARNPPVSDPKRSAAYTRLADQVQSWATESARGTSYVKQFVEARARIER